MSRAVLAAALWLAAALPALAGEPSCAVPEDLRPGRFDLPLAQVTARRAGELVVMTLGGAATAGAVAGSDAATYPVRLEAELAARLAPLRVRVVNRAAPGHGAGFAVRNLPGWLAEVRPALVVWGTGAREMAHGSDPETLAAAVQHGIDLVHDAQADIVLLDLQYAPVLARVGAAMPYRGALQGAAAANGAVFFPRYDLMHAWSDSGVLDFAAQGTAAHQAVARRLFACLAAALAEPIAEALK